MAESQRRQVMVRPGTLLPALPADVVARAFGTTPDPRVEFAVLTFEYWHGSGATLTTQYAAMMKLLPGILTAVNANAFLAILDSRGLAEDFFALTQLNIDTDARLRSLLSSIGLGIETIRAYAKWDGFSPDLFIKGFTFGVAQSFVAIFTDIYDLVNGVGSLVQTVFGASLNFVTNPPRTLETLLDRARLVRDGLMRVLGALDPRQLPAFLIKEWTRWSDEFVGRVEGLDPFEAGRMLGKAAGDLWQLLTGALAVAKLLRIAGPSILRFATVAVGTLRRTAVAATAILSDLVKILAAVGAASLDAVPRVGLGALRALVPPRALEQLCSAGRALVTVGDLSLLHMPQPAYAAVSSGRHLRSPHSIFVMQDNRPLLMASLSEDLAAPGAVPARAELLDAVIDRVETVMSAPHLRPPVKQPPSQLAVLAAIAEQSAQRLQPKLLDLVRNVSTTVFDELRKTGARFHGGQFGTAVHARMQSVAPAAVRAAAPGSLVIAERSLDDVIALLAADSGSAPSIPKSAQGMLDKTVAWVLANSDGKALDALGVPPGAKSRSAEAIGTQLRKWTWEPTTRVGNLRSDLIVADPQISRFRSIDWTTSTSTDTYEQLFSRAKTDLGAAFTGDLENVAAAYAKAGIPVPTELNRDIARLLAHANRETVLRATVLRAVLGDDWFVSSAEILYDGLRVQWSKVAALVD